jgi:two-component system KDP operon response regulator KdpE
MKILIVDSDRSLVEAITISLELRWSPVQVLSATDGQTGLDLFCHENPDMTLLDVNLPGLSGWEMLKQARAVSAAPVIILTARGQELDKVKGLELGADDYLTKPFSHLELFARMKAVLRRCGGDPTPAMLPPFAAGDLTVNFSRREVMVRGERVALTPTEYSLLQVLVHHAGRVMPVATLLSKIWGEEHRHTTPYLKTYISRLRRKLGDSAEMPRYILTKRGVGYLFARPGTLAPSH